MVLPFQYSREGGGRPQNFMTFISGGVSVHPSFWLIDVGGDPTNGPHPGEFLPQVVKKASGDATVEMERWELDISPAGKLL